MNKLFSCALILFFTQISMAASSITLETLPKGTDFLGGCGCRAQNAAGENLIAGDMKNKSSIQAQIDGTKRDLKWVSSTEKKGAKPKKDALFTRIYVDGSTQLTLKYKTTFACPVKSESCEVTRYSIDAILEDGQRKNEIKSLVGDCGC